MHQQSISMTTCKWSDFEVEKEYETCMHQGSTQQLSSSTKNEIKIKTALKITKTSMSRHLLTVPIQLGFLAEERHS